VIRALLDEMLTPAIADQLNQRGHDVTAVKTSPGLIALSDEDLLAEATSDQRLLITLNVRDFVLIDRNWKAAGRAHAGLVYVMTSTFPQNRGFVGALVGSLDAASTSGALPDPDGTTFLARVS
jgi:hypothetical protein